MATRKSTTKKRSSKSSSTKTRASTSEKARKAAGASRARKARKASSKKRAPQTGAESSVSLTGAACNTCVRAVIGRVSGRVPKLDDKMSDLFVPCNAGVMRRLADAIRAECSNRNVTIVCGMTVRRVINEYCG